MTTKLPEIKSHVVFENRQEEQLPAIENKLVTGHPFNCSAEAFLPAPEASLASIRSQLRDAGTYFTADVPLANFLRVEFIENHLKKGKLHGVTVGCGVDREDCVALLPSGDLVLSLTKDTYVELGLEGQPSTFQPGQRHLVTINLTASHCRPEKKYYKRMQWCLSDRLQLVFPFVFVYSDHSTASAERLSQDLGVKCEKHELDTKCRTWQRLHTPVLPANIRLYPTTQAQPSQATGDTTSSGSQGSLSTAAVADFPPEEEFIEACFEFHEWIGAMMCGIDLQDGFVSSLDKPDSVLCVEECCSVQWAGCLSATSITSILSELRSLMSSRNLPWASLCVWGFEDSPVGWHGKEHGWRMSGSNHYAVVLLPQNRYWVFAVGPT